MTEENEEEIQEEETLPEIEEGEEDTTDWKAEALKQHGIAKRFKTKLDKAKIEVEKKENKTEEKVEEKIGEKKDVKEQISQRDTIAIIKADISDEDISYVEKYAKLEGISIADALKTKELQEILNVKKEQRKTTETTNVSNVKRGSQKLSDEALLQKARNNEEVDLEAVAKARMEEKKAKNKK